MIVFGPIPSRRLGQSLGINHIPPKHCSYDCVYCQVGPTTFDQMERRDFHPPERVIHEVSERVRKLREDDGRIDYLSFVPDGEPTLDLGLGAMIEGLRPLGIPIAVFTNSSLLWREDVRADLAGADLVSIKVDAADEAAWKKVNRPVAGLVFARVLDGLRTFAADYRGRLISETMLVRGINDRPPILRHTAELVAELAPGVAYLGIPTRPPSERWVEAPDEGSLTAAHEIFAARLEAVEILAGFSPDSFEVTGDPVRDLLAITAVHPMRESEAEDFLERSGAEAGILERLVADDELVRVTYRGGPFYLRRLAAATAHR